MNISTNITKTETNYFFYSLIFYSIVVLYLIPYELKLPYAKVCLPILTSILILQICYYKKKLLIVDILAVCLVLVVTFLNLSTYQLFRYSLPICLLAICFSGSPQIQIKRSYLIGLCWCATIAMIYQMIFYRRLEFDGSQRIALSNGDPNVSGLFMLIFFFLSVKIKFKPGIILGLVSTVLFASRNYFITLCIFLILTFLEKPLFRIVKIINVSVIFIISNLFGLLVGEFFLNRVEVGFVYDTSINRLFSFNDQSNLVRFEANRFLINSYANNLDLALKGYGEKYESVFRPIGAIIHNSFLEVMAYTGIPLGILYFYIFLRVVSGYCTQENLKFIFSYLFFCLFLHTGLQGIAPLLFISILAMSVDNDKPNRISLFNMLGY
ncbi:hypothetical protein NIES2098_51600 [Calothrix sp. NIES-2098]|nr:hypothetical protein NIES2098_51600 [Calothrix sp. NIES-2098]